MENNNDRREFLKKVVYKAPVVLTLGALVAPASASAFGTGTGTGNEEEPDNSDDSDEIPGGF